MGKIGMHLLGVLLVLSAVFGIGFGIYILVAESVWISAFGLPVEVTGVPKVALGIFCFLPAVVLGFLFLTFRKSGGG